MAKANANTEVVENTAEGTGTTPEGAGTVEAAQEGPKKVTVRLHKDRAKSEPVFVSVNGERFIIQRGVDVEVPDYVAEVLDHSRRQDIAAADYRDGLVKRYEAKAKQQ